MKIYPITPNTKPRMTQSDKWKKRPCVLQYRAFKDEVRLHKVVLPESHHVTFVVPMPSSWSLKKQKAHYGKPHQQRPDHAVVLPEHGFHRGSRAAEAPSQRSRAACRHGITGRPQDGAEQPEKGNKPNRREKACQRTNRAP